MESLIEEILNRIAGLDIVVVGDLILDGYIWGGVERISPEAPVQVLEWKSENSGLGGACNVANNLISLRCSVHIVGIIGRDEKGEELRALLKQTGIDETGLVVDPNRPTTMKTRIIAQNQQILRIDKEDRAPVAAGVEERVCSEAERLMAGADGVICSDYNKGMLSENVMRRIVSLARERGKKVTVDPKGVDYDKYRGATLLTPNRHELELALGRKIADRDEMSRLSLELIDRLEMEALVVTLGGDGIFLARRDGRTLHAPAEAQEVYDVTGAGDTVISFVTMGLLAGMDLPDAVGLANKAAGIVVGKVGASTVSRHELLQRYQEHFPDAGSKIVRLTELKRILSLARNQRKRVVFTNGCFDLLHIGHISYLQQARRFGDLLVVGLNSDESVRDLKGPGRPLIGENERAHILSALSFVDYVIVFSEPTPQNLISQLRPDVLVKGGDYTKETVVGRDIVEGYGGRVEIVPFIENVSTSNIVKRIVENFH